MLFAHAGRAFCPQCGKRIQRQTVDQMVDALVALGEKTKLMILGPVAVGKKGTHKKLLDELRKELLKEIVNCKIIKPQKGNKANLVAMANENAKEQLQA